jgi:iron-sulfur cluster insertion protein
MSDEETPITLTDKAAEMVLKIRADESIPADHALRLQVRGGGCAGFSYDLYFDQPKTGIDRRFTIKGVEIVVDQMSLMYLSGTEIDYVEGLMGSGFRFKNPNVKSTCGCGSSFSA